MHSRVSCYGKREWACDVVQVLMGFERGVGLLPRKMVRYLRENLNATDNTPILCYLISDLPPFENSGVLTVDRRCNRQSILHSITLGYPLFRAI